MHLNSIFFEVKGIKFKVIATESDGYLAKDCIDTVMNLSSGKIKKIVRRKLISLIQT
jgi:hypothetical protein